MATLLHITVSTSGNHSISRRLAATAVRAWKDKNPEGLIIERDLAKTPLTFVDVDWIAGAFSPQERHNENHKKALALSDELIAELLAADEIILATPMYNFSVPAVLKAWVDHVVRAGKTFRYTAAGTSEGLLAGKGRRVLVIVASGGSYPEGTSLAALNHEVPYLRLILGFIGLTDLRFIHAAGTAGVAQGKISAEEFLSPYLNETAAAVGKPADRVGVTH